MSDVPQVFERSMFKCGHPRQRAPDGHWMACADPRCSRTPQAKYYVVPVLVAHAIEDHVYSRRYTSAGAIWSHHG